MLLNCGVGEDSWESLGLQGDPTSPFWRRSALGVHWKDWCWSWNSNILATWCKQLTHWKRPWCWERLKAGGEGDDRGWDGWMASPTWWTWVWASSRSWWWTGRPGMLQSMGSQRVGHDWTELIQWKISLCWGMFPCKFEVYVQYKCRHLVCVCVCVCVCVQWFLTLCDPMDCSPSGFSVYGIFQATLEQTAISSSRRSSQPRDRTRVACTSCIGRGFFTTVLAGKERHLWAWGPGEKSQLYTNLSQLYCGIFLPHNIL